MHIVTSVVFHVNPVVYEVNPVYTQGTYDYCQLTRNIHTESINILHQMGTVSSFSNRISSSMVE